MSMDMTNVGPWLVIGTAAITFLLLIIIMIQGSQIRKLKRRFQAVMRESGVDDLESLLGQMQAEIERLHARNEEQTSKLQLLSQKVKAHAGHVGIVRYNAFDQSGGELSFSAAVLDEQSSGFILTGIHSRDHSYVYAKPVESGQSMYTLSPEEQKAMEQAMSKRSS
ncbi:DUF4446 family protein [Paenibacillus sp. SC116]|uniref:DUF4446 family protein n=1 Tax=Paenibacillus sp. SC116 TaxID=2968986 RepID=UPI00215A7A70|nr:DUF4446 family protein [Paenibacillus sp. SC116]